MLWRRSAQKSMPSGVIGILRIYQANYYYDCSALLAVRYTVDRGLLRIVCMDGGWWGDCCVWWVVHTTLRYLHVFHLKATANNCQRYRVTSTARVYGCLLLVLVLYLRLPLVYLYQYDIGDYCCAGAQGSTNKKLSRHPYDPFNLRNPCRQVARALAKTA